MTFPTLKTTHMLPKSLHAIENNDKIIFFLYLNISYLPECKATVIKTTPKNKSLLKKYFTINFTHLIHKARQILSTFTNQWYCLHLHGHCLHPPHTHF
jgi:hypothetical protein